MIKYEWFSNIVRNVKVKWNNGVEIISICRKKQITVKTKMILLIIMILIIFIIVILIIIILIDIKVKKLRARREI